MEIRNKRDYTSNVECNTIVAFIMEVCSGDKKYSKMLSGKVIENSDPEFVTVQTKNLSIYEINRNDISWVKTGSRWPKPIFLALKMKTNSEAYTDE